MFGWFKKKKSKKKKVEEQVEVFLEALKETKDGKEILKKIEKKYGIKEEYVIPAFKDLLNIVISISERGKKKR